MDKRIDVSCCEECPFYGKCKAWKKLTSGQRVKLTIGVGVGKFILKGCHLSDKEPQWLDIESAPKEVTRMLAIDEEGDIEVIDYGENWCSHGCYVPTHFQYLPKPPQECDK